MGEYTQSAIDHIRHHGPLFIKWMCDEMVAHADEITEEAVERLIKGEQSYEDEMFSWDGARLWVERREEYADALNYFAAALPTVRERAVRTKMMNAALLVPDSLSGDDSGVE